MTHHLRANSDDLTYNDPVIEAKILLCHVTGFSFSQLISNSHETVDIGQIEIAFAMLERRILGEPIAYITQEQAFWTLSLEVSRDTLIPRADTETLVEHALSLVLPERASVLDLGTGTGAVALALACEKPKWQISACDFQLSIVKLAQRNAVRNKLNINCYLSDWFAQVPAQKFDLIVSNPPYVELDSEYLHKGDLRFEPASALTAANNGLADIQHIIASAPEYLLKGGWLMLEHGYQQTSVIQGLFAEQSFYKIKTIKDLNGQDRVSMAQFNT